MTYASLDNNFADHPNNWPLSDAAFRLQTAAICYANRHLTDGAIPKDRVAALVPRFRARTVTELLQHHWEDKGDRYVIRDYLDWNQSRVQVEAYKAGQSASGRKGAQARWHPA